MPTCPKCGSPRVDRFCAKCGAEAVVEPDERGYTPRTDYVDRGIPAAAKPIKRSRRVPFTSVVFTCLLIGLGITALTFVFTGQRSMTTSRSRFPTDPQMDQLLRDFDLDAGNRIAEAAHSLNKLATTSTIELRLNQAKNEFAQASATRVRLGSALRQARLEDRWPVTVDGVSFRTPQQLVDAMATCDVYLRKAAAAEQELGRALDQNKKLQSDANGMVDEMKRFRTQADSLQSPDRSLLSVDQRQIEALSNELKQRLRDWTEVDWNKANLPSFYLRTPQ